MPRELETGTFRYAWTQGFGRWRWTVAKLVTLAVVVTAAAGALECVVLVVLRAVLRRGQPGALALRAVAVLSCAVRPARIGFAVWVLVAFAIGVLAGVLVRRVVPAIVRDLGRVRRRRARRRERGAPPLSGAARDDQTQRARFRVDLQPTMDERRNLRVQQLAGRPAHAHPAVRFDPRGAARQALPGDAFPVLRAARLRAADPVSTATRFWTFQWIEAGGLLALSALLIAATVWLVHPRAEPTGSRGCLFRRTLSEQLRGARTRRQVLTGDCGVGSGAGLRQRRLDGHVVRWARASVEHRRSAPGVDVSIGATAGPDPVLLGVKTSGDRYPVVPGAARTPRHPLVEAAIDMFPPPHNRGRDHRRVRGSGRLRCGYIGHGRGCPARHARGGTR